MTEIEKDASLLRCTLKKSWSVFGKVLKYGTYLVGAIVAIVFAFYGAIAIYELVTPGLASVWQFMVAVPWYYYVGIVGVAAIPVYSALWCIARDLTEEDWKSDAAKNSAFTVFALAFFALAFPPSAFAFFALAFFALAVFTFTFFALALTKPGSIWYYIGRFFGAAYHHYMKKEKPE